MTIAPGHDGAAVRSVSRGRGRARALPIGVALAALLPSAAPTWAQPRPQPPELAAAAADTALRRGLALYDKGDFAGAAEVWEALLESLGDEQGFKVLYNLGLAHEAAGDATRAIERFEGFLRGAALQPAAISATLAERRADAEARIRSLKASHGALVVAAPASGEPPLVRVGDAAPRRAGFTVYLAPGTVELEMQGRAAKPRRVRVELAAGRRVSVAAEEPAPPAPIVPRAAPGAAEGSGVPPSGSARIAGASTSARGPTPWIVAGVGAALTAVSVALPAALGRNAEAERDRALSLGRGHTGYAAAADDFATARTEYYASLALPSALAAATPSSPSCSCGARATEHARAHAGVGRKARALGRSAVSKRAPHARRGRLPG